jgi:antitoxin MazE
LRLKLTRIGNSRCVRIPKPLIEQCGLGDVVELGVTPEGLIIAPHRAPRNGWKQAFISSPTAEQEMLLERISSNAFDGKKWRW